MTTVNITELRRQLSAYVERAANGELLRVTRSGRVVAELGPPTRGAQQAGQVRARLAGSVQHFVDPFAPVLEPSRWDDRR